jgi:hypothetical protein
MLAPPSLLNGPGYTVDATLAVVAYMRQFILRASRHLGADYTKRSIGVSALASIAQCSQLNQSRALAYPLAVSATRTGAVIGQAVMNPVETVSGIPTGLGHYFQSAATTNSRATEPQAAPSRNKVPAPETPRGTSLG